MKSTGYSGTPLAKKLGIKDGFNIRIINQPDHYLNLFEGFPENIHIRKEKKTKKDFIHYFTKQVKELERDIVSLKNELVPNGMIWISWPKKIFQNSNGCYRRCYPASDINPWISRH